MIVLLRCWWGNLFAVELIFPSSSIGALIPTLKMHSFGLLTSCFHDGGMPLQILRAFQAKMGLRAASPDRESVSGVPSLFCTCLIPRSCAELHAVCEFSSAWFFFPPCCGWGFIESIRCRHWGPLTPIVGTLLSRWRILSMDRPSPLT